MPRGAEVVLFCSGRYVPWLFEHRIVNIDFVMSIYWNFLMFNPMSWFSLSMMIWYVEWRTTGRTSRMRVIRRNDVIIAFDCWTNVENNHEWLYNHIVYVINGRRISSFGHCQCSGRHVPWTGTKSFDFKCPGRRRDNKTKRIFFFCICINTYVLIEKVCFNNKTQKNLFFCTCINVMYY